LNEDPELLKEQEKVPVAAEGAALETLPEETPAPDPAEQDIPSEGPGKEEQQAEAPNASAKKKKKKRSAKSYAISLFIKIGITALIIWALLTFIVGIHISHTNAAFPMVKDGDLCITYKLAKLEAGDEIVYKKDGEIRFGRIIAFGGDTVKIDNNTVTVNNYVSNIDTVYPTPTEGAKISFPYKVPKDKIFVLNDYRKDLNDSRRFGAVPEEDVEGVVIFVMRKRGI